MEVHLPVRRDGMTARCTVLPYTFRDGRVEMTSLVSSFALTIGECSPCSLIRRIIPTSYPLKSQSYTNLENVAWIWFRLDLGGTRALCLHLWPWLGILYLGFTVHPITGTSRTYPWFNENPRALAVRRVFSGQPKDYLQVRGFFSWLSCSGLLALPETKHLKVGELIFLLKNKFGSQLLKVYGKGC